MFCKNCGKNIPEGAKFCNGCGAKAEPAQAAPQPQPAYTPPQTYMPQQAYASPSPASYSAQSGREPLRVIQYIGMFLLMGIPLVGIILMFVWSFGSSVNLNKKNFARAMLILGGIGAVLSIIFGTVIMSMISDLLRSSGGYY